MVRIYCTRQWRAVVLWTQVTFSSSDTVFHVTTDWAKHTRIQFVVNRCSAVSIQHALTASWSCRTVDDLDRWRPKTTKSGACYYKEVWNYTVMSGREFAFFHLIFAFGTFSMFPKLSTNLRLECPNPVARHKESIRKGGVWTPGRHSVQVQWSMRASLVSLIMAMSFDKVSELKDGWSVILPTGIVCWHGLALVWEISLVPNLISRLNGVTELSNLQRQLAAETQSIRHYLSLSLYYFILRGTRISLSRFTTIWIL